MADKPRLKYEKPISIDMGRVSPVLGDRCSIGSGASDCSYGVDNSQLTGCQAGSVAKQFCWSGGTAGGLACLTGNVFNSGSSASNFFRRK